MGSCNSALSTYSCAVTSISASLRPQRSGATREVRTAEKFPRKSFWGKVFNFHDLELNWKSASFISAAHFDCFEPREVKKFNKKELSCSFQIISK